MWVRIRRPAASPRKAPTPGPRQPLFRERVVESVDLVPVAAGEVRELDRHIPVLDGDAGEFSDAAPLGEVINILVQRQAVVQAVYQAVVHDEVHSAVSADLLSLLTNMYIACPDPESAQ